MIDDGTISAADLGPDSVDSDQLVDGAIDRIHISDGAVGSQQIGSGAVGAGQIADDSVGWRDLDITVAGGSIALTSGESQEEVVSCPAGYWAISGSWRQVGTGGGPRQKGINQWNNGATGFAFFNQTWSFGFFNPSGGNVDIFMRVICVRQP
jgi:hypothetical protein